MAKHWRSFLESKTLSVGDLPDAAPTADNIVRIVKVEAGRVKYSDGDSTRVMLHLQGFKKPWSCGPRILQQIADLYGAIDPQINWPGKAIAIYATTDRFGPNTVDAIRVRKTKPHAQAKAFCDADTGAAPFDLDGTLAEIAACETAEDVEAVAASLKTVVPKGPNRDAVKAALDAKRATFAPTAEAAS